MINNGDFLFKGMKEIISFSLFKKKQILWSYLYIKVYLRIVHIEPFLCILTNEIESIFKLGIKDK